MKKLTIENIRNFIIGAALPAILTCFGAVTTPAQNTCMTAQAILVQKDKITQAEVTKECDCWVVKLKNGEKTLVGAFLYGADLTGSRTTSTPDYANVDLTNAVLSEARFERTNLTGAKFSNALMTSTKLDGAWLLRAVFTGADLTSASLSGANVLEATFTNADLRAANLENCGFATRNERFDEKRKEYADEDWRGDKGIDKAAMDAEAIWYAKTGASVAITGAKINSATKGTSAAYWKSRGGVVVVD